MSTDFTPRFSLSRQDRLVINNIAYKRRNRLANGYVLERVEDPDVAETFTDRDLLLASAKSDFRFERNAFAESKASATAGSVDGLIGWLPEEQQEEVLWRTNFCGEYEKEIQARNATLSDASYKNRAPIVAQRIHDAELLRTKKRNADGEIIKPKAGERELGCRKPPSARTYRKWRKWFLEGGERAIALRKRYFRSGNRVTERLGLPERQIMHRFALEYMSESRPTKRDVYRLMKAHIVDEENPKRLAASEKPLRVPSYERLAAEINSFPEFDVQACRHGLDAARKRFAMVRNGVDVERPLQRVEIDEWRINLQTLCADLGILDKLSDKLKSEIATARPWLCAALDSATSVCVGFKIALTPSSDLAMDTLEMVVTPKAPYALAAGALSRDDYYGSPERIVTDQGAAFLSLRFRRAIIDLEADAEAPPAGLPALRGRIERFFRTAGTQALCPFTGRTFESIAAKGDYDPVARVSLTLLELCDVITRWVLDIYHNTPHAGLKGETPANCWKRLVKAYGVIPAPDRHRRRAVFGVKANRCLTPKGVRMLGLHYNSRELQEFRRRNGDVTLEVRLNHMDLGHVSVRLDDGGWLPVPNVRSGFDDVPMTVWLAAEADLKRRFKAQAVLADEVVAKAVKDAWELGKASAARVSIFSTRPSTEELNYTEDELGFAFDRPAQLPEGGTSLSGNLLEGSIPTGACENAALSPAAPKAKPRSFKITD
ncbi:MULTISPECIES: Mu transposase C-terminal domain-containing protein [Bosea]|uniref:Transposase n=1 Tax=Bosea robiniae TaxID=1036780 RepID=A0ABY0P4R9_9HYPH|nr:MULTISPECIES: Mu transposase C-terminal domain-containing protein [Bosea]TQI72413.1 putative transposase [Bosea sp. AK1]SDH32220.1 putative transposase [Bosea robiniae]